MTMFSAAFVALLLSSAQTLPSLTNPVTFCGQQYAPADVVSYTLTFDGSPPELLTMDAAVNTACPVGSTHSFTLPASRFTVGLHTVRVDTSNTYGITIGPVYTLTVGICTVGGA